MVVMTSDDENRVRALVRLDLAADAFLYVGRLVDERVLGHMESTSWAVQRYEELEGNRFSLQITFALIFLVVALLLLLVARSEEHTSELQSLMRNSYAVFCLNKKKTPHHQ